MNKDKKLIEIKTAAKALAAVKNNGDALRFVPENLKTMELCLAAVEKIGSALQFIPKNMRKEFSLTPVKKKKK